MPVTKAKKKAQVEKLNADLKNVSSMVVATYSKLTVAQDYELRKTLRGAGAKYKVVKNTLAQLAAKGTKVEQALKDLGGDAGIHLQGRRSRGPRDLYQGDRIVGFHAFEGRVDVEAVVPDQRSGAAIGHCDERSRTQSGGRCGSGRAAEEIYG